MVINILQCVRIMFVQKILGLTCVMLCLDCMPCVSIELQGNVLQEAEMMLKADCGDACLRVETFFALGSPPSCDSFLMACCQVLRNITMLLEPTDANGTETVCVIYADHQTLACTFICMLLRAHAFWNLLLNMRCSRLRHCSVDATQRRSRGNSTCV